MNASVDDIRQSIRYRRRRLGAGFKSRAASVLVNKIKASSVYQRSKHIALYLENDGELSCRPLIKQIWKDGKCCYLPVLAPKQASPPMRFSMYRPGAALVKNRYGIFEPTGTQGRLPQSLDLVLMPLVAFDAVGHRIGMGGGYYDRSFAFKSGVGVSGRAKKVCPIKAPFLMGVAYRFQKVKSISPQAWDVMPDRVLAV
ncbi:MAG: 5-formyltetrahydrofolate cyclo-ligase [Cellvibrionaceae bacterium]